MAIIGHEGRLDLGATEIHANSRHTRMLAGMDPSTERLSLK
jgi:hypothetical protein